MISKDKWAEIIKNFQESSMPEIIERDIDIPLDIPIHRSVSLIGPRRAGKTYEIFQIIKKLLNKGIKKDQMLYINFERADINFISAQDLILMLETFYELYPENKNKKVWMFLDEIQNVKDWERFVRTALDDNIHIYLTSSSSKLLSKEIATSMRGRNITYTILPFSFKEYLRAKNFRIEKFFSSSEKAKLLNLLKTYMEYGGYPEAVIFDSEREKILNEIIETTIYKDVIERAKIRNTNVMKLLIKALINSKEFSVNKFYNFLKSTGVKLGKNILYNYINFLNEAFFVFMLRKFSYSYKVAEQSIPKPYIIDNGLLRISGISDYGRLMENLVFVELLRRRLDVSYYHSLTKEEVDFVIEKNKIVNQLIQVCYNPDNLETKDREVKALIKSSNELNCNNLLIITSDKEDEEVINKKKIKYIPLWKWLLE